MKKFKDILNEFKFSNSDGGGNSDRGSAGDHERRIKEFMKKTPFTHVTTGEHEIHFHSALDAAHSLAASLAEHEAGRVHAQNTGDKQMHEYFMASAGTHDDVLDAIQNHIMNHKDLPYDLIDSVPEVISHIETDHGMEHETPDKQKRMGEFAVQTHKPKFKTARHPNLMDDTHHLKNIIQGLKDNPDDGYFLKKQEYKD